MQPIPTRTPILRSAKDWLPWVTYIESEAARRGVWEYVRPPMPAHEETPAVTRTPMPQKPVRPQMPAITDETGQRKDAAEISALKDIFQLEVGDFALRRDEYKEVKGKLDEIAATIMATVSSDLKLFVSVSWNDKEEERSPADLLDALKGELRIGDALVAIQLEDDWTRLLSQDLKRCNLEAWVRDVKRQYVLLIQLGSGLVDGWLPHREVLKRIRTKYTTSVLAPFSRELTTAARTLSPEALPFTQFVEDILLTIHEESDLRSSGMVYASYQGQPDDQSRDLSRCRFCKKRKSEHEVAPGQKDDDIEALEDWKTCPAVSKTVMPETFSSYDLYERTKRGIDRWLGQEGNRKEVEDYWKERQQQQKDAGARVSRIDGLTG